MLFRTTVILQCITKKQGRKNKKTFDILNVMFASKNPIYN